jgi:hypothetical protein
MQRGKLVSRGLLPALQIQYQKQNTEGETVPVLVFGAAVVGCSGENLAAVRQRGVSTHMAPGQELMEFAYDENNLDREGGRVGFGPHEPSKYPMSPKK